MKRSEKIKENVLNLFVEDEALKENEISANKQMIITCAVSSIALVVIFLCYVFKLFLLSNYTLIYIIMSINILAMLSPIPFRKTKHIERPWFKYYLMGLFLYVVASINIVVPKHGVLGWALPIILSNHFYSKKFGLVTFISTTILMLLCLYLGMFFGEYDPHLLTEGVIIDGKIVNPDTPQWRFQFLNQLYQQGENRYLKVFVYYYFPRVTIMTLVFFVSQALNKRTFALLLKERNIDSEKQKLENELQIAAKIQEAALPKGDFVNDEVSIKGALYPAKQIGGDFYDYAFLDRHHIAFVIGDVSGKGAPAALFMMKTITCFRDSISLDKSPLEIMTEVNSRLVKGNDGEMFVTAFFGVLDTRSGELRYVNAGHCQPLISRGKKFFYLPCSTGFIMGASEDAPFKEESIHIDPCEMICLYTDGITEAKGKNDELFGKHRLLSLVNRFEYKTTNELFREVVDEIATFVGDVEQSDDLTAMVIHYIYEDVHWEEKSLVSSKENVDTAIEFFLGAMETDHFPKQIIKSMAIVVDEIYSNISKYAYGDQEGTVFLRYCFYKDTQELKMVFIDHGVPYDPTKRKLNTVTENSKEGGLGLLIVNNIMDDVDYDRRNMKNFLVLTKKIEMK